MLKRIYQPLHIFFQIPKLAQVKFLSFHQIMI